jgi:histidyl-tRNA synthetase
MRDIDSDEMNRRLWLYDKIREVVLRYGYQLVEPTTLENLKTLEAKSGPSIRNEIYWFRDKSGRRLGLRFDLTVGLARMVATRTDLPEPIKLATIGGNWRYDEPQFGRYRYFTQWDIEIFGSDSPLADAEVITVGADILNNVGLKDFVIRISNRKLIEGYLRQLGIRSGKRLDQCLRIIDKIRKANREQLEKEFRTLRVSPSTSDEIFSFILLNGPPSNVAEKFESFSFAQETSKKAVEELRTLADALKANGRVEKCVYDMSIVRGIGYYDGIVFEAFDRGGEDVGSIFGGGRYDKLCQTYGKRAIPATGVAGGIERLMISLERGDLFPKNPVKAKVFIASVQENLKSNVMQLAQSLRDQGISAEIDLKARPLSKQLEYADSTKIPYLIVIGPKELQSGTVRIKEMATRQETEVSMDALVEKLRSLD